MLAVVIHKRPSYTNNLLSLVDCCRIRGKQPVPFSIASWARDNARRVTRGIDPNFVVVVF